MIKEKSIIMNSFNCNKTFWASLLTVLVLYPIAVLLIKYLNIQYTANQTQLIILCLSLIFGFLIITMKSTIQKIHFFKTFENLTIRVDEVENQILSNDLTYNIYNFLSRKAFMIRITDINKTHYYLSSEMNLKSDTEFYFSNYAKKDSSKDFWAKSFAIGLCIAYVIITIVFVLFI